MARPRAQLLRSSWLLFRVRLTIVFAAVMAAVLIALGAVLYAQFRNDLDDQVDSALSARLVGVRRSSSWAASGRHAERLGQAGCTTRRAESSGLVKVKRVRLLTAAEAVRATHGEIDVDR